MKPRSVPFDYTLDFDRIDFRKHPELYRIGKGEQGVLLVEPYKGELLPHWRFKTVAEAKKSSAKIYKMFLAYLKAEDFPGADMARKFLQMGWTRARRYANHKGGRKYDKKTGEELPRVENKEKAEAAAIFYERYVTARQHPEYVKQKALHREKHESQGWGSAKPQLNGKTTSCLSDSGGLADRHPAHLASISAIGPSILNPTLPSSISTASNVERSRTPKNSDTTSSTASRSISSKC
jgi:hypothetical protein